MNKTTICAFAAAIFLTGGALWFSNSIHSPLYVLDKAGTFWCLPGLDKKTLEIGWSTAGRPSPSDWRPPPAFIKIKLEKTDVAVDAPVHLGFEAFKVSSIDIRDHRERTLKTYPANYFERKSIMRRLSSEIDRCNPTDKVVHYYE
jgi:hypothetical protein